jgi:hypothetical protein
MDLRLLIDCGLDFVKDSKNSRSKQKNFAFNWVSLKDGISSRKFFEYSAKNRHRVFNRNL